MDESRTRAAGHFRPPWSASDTCFKCGLPWADHDNLSFHRLLTATGDERAAERVATVHAAAALLKAFDALPLGIQAEARDLAMQDSWIVEARRIDAEPRTPSETSP